MEIFFWVRTTVTKHYLMLNFMYPGGLPMCLRHILQCPGTVTVLEHDVAYAVFIPNNQDGDLVG